MEFNRVFFTILLFILIPVVLFVFVMPKYQEFTVMQDALVQKQAEFEGKSIYYTKVKELLAEIEARQEALGKIDSALPQDFSYAQLVYSLQKNASDAGLEILGINFSPAAANPASTGVRPLKEALFSLKVSGSYQSLKTFTASLENSARLFQVVSLSFAVAVDPISSTPSKAVVGKEKKYDFGMVIKTNSY